MIYIRLMQLVFGVGSLALAVSGLKTEAVICASSSCIIAAIIHTKQ